MMLPQILRKVDFNDLEELCAAELTGMSKTRILTILDGKEMLESSATDDTDDSGPSLEIISDTEWLSDGEPTVKVEGAKNSKLSKKLKKKKSDNKTKSKSKEKGAEKKSNVQVKLEKVKLERKEKDKAKEKDKDKEKDKKKEKGKEKDNDKEKEKEKKELPKEGGTGSLLDLLELEMRARAIRALIRKEEDSSISNSKNKVSNEPSNPASEASTSNDNGSKARQASLKKQLEKIDVLIKHGEEDDVYVVINPAPTIDLLSSDSENESNTKRTNKKLVNERKSGGEVILEKNIESSEETNKLIDSNEAKISDAITPNNNKDDVESEKKETENSIKNLNLPITAMEVDENEKPNDSLCKNASEELEDGEILDDENDKKDANEQTNEPVPSLNKSSIKKIKKNLNIRQKKKYESDSDKEKPCQNQSSRKEIDKEESIQASKEASLDETIEIQDSPERQENTDAILNSRKSDLIRVSSVDTFDDDKSLDIEEIINLDNYPDEMDDSEKLEPTEDSVSKKQENNDGTSEKDEVSFDKSETWASRYIQQDGVQNVIKESKIQSEIRKRLRERQRQSKLNNSPKLDGQELNQEAKPTGSVEEYLALKGIEKDLSNQSFEMDKTDLSTENDQDSKQDDTNSEVEQSDEVVAKPVVIVKKPQLKVKILSIEKVDPVNQILAVERVSKIVKTTESIFQNNSSAEAFKVEDQPVNCDIQSESSNNAQLFDDSVQNLQTTVEIDSTKEAVKTGSTNETIEEIVESTTVEGDSIEKVIRSAPTNLEDDSAIHEESISVRSSSPKNRFTDKLAVSDVNESFQNSEEKNSSMSREDELNTSRSDSSDDNIVVKIDNISPYPQF